MGKGTTPDIDCRNRYITVSDLVILYIREFAYVAGRRPVWEEGNARDAGQRSRNPNRRATDEHR